MFSTVLIFLVGFVVGEVIGYLIHRLLHTPLSGRLNRAHMTHHLKLYPTTDFVSEKYRDPGKDNTMFIFTAFIVVACALMFIFFPLKIAIIVSAEFAALGFINDYIHDIFHIHPNWLEKYRWFQRLRRIHYHHHVDMSKNFGIFSFLGDRIFRTFSKPGHRASN